MLTIEACTAALPRREIDTVVVGASQAGPSVSSAPREPRHYRGKDVNYWLDLMGALNVTVADPGNPVERDRAKPHCSGRDGGHALNLAAFANSGIRLVGRIEDARGPRLKVAPDLRRNMAAADAASRRLMKEIDAYIDATAILSKSAASALVPVSISAGNLGWTI